MAFNLISDYRGFIRFIASANNELVRWFGPHCNNEPTRLAFMAAREWDGLADLEKKPFLKSDQCPSPSWTRINPYITYLQHLRHSGKDISSPKNGRSIGQEWKSMTPEQQEVFSSMGYVQPGAAHVLERRDHLHKLYDPKKLCLLEFILKTKPKWPVSARLWFYRHEYPDVIPSEAIKKWDKLDENHRGVYERCAFLDSKRYDFEKNAWLTKILTIDMEADNFTLSDFHIPEAKSRIESLGSFVELSRNLPSTLTLRRPRAPFSLFIEAYRYQIRDERPEFQFARHLRECSEAWAKLSPEEKEKYSLESKKLVEERRSLLADEPHAGSRLSIPDPFKTTSSIDGPNRPAHLTQRSIPSPEHIWAKENNVPMKHLKQEWEKVPLRLRQSYERKQREMIDSREKEKTVVETKLKQVKQLLREATKLEELKRELRLIGSSGKALKNLHD